MLATIFIGDAREVLARTPSGSVHCCVTSPPYFGLRSYLPDGHSDKAREMGREQTPAAFVSALVATLREVKRVLRDDGTLWVNLGDSYASGSKWGGETGGKAAAGLHGKTGVGRGRTFPGVADKNLIGIPWRVAFALQDDGWYWRQWMPWVKRNPMPESTKDRPTSACEVWLMFSKNERYFYDHEAVMRAMAPSSLAQYQTPYKPRTVKGGGQGAQDGAAVKARMVDKQRGHSRRHAGFNDRWDAMEKERQCMSRSFRNSDLFYESLQASHGAIADAEGGLIAFDVATKPFRGAHFAVYPTNLVVPIIRAACPVGGTVLDPFGGAGTTALVASRLNRKSVSIELNPESVFIADMRLIREEGLFAEIIDFTKEGANDI